MVLAPLVSEGLASIVGTGAMARTRYVNGKIVVLVSDLNITCHD